MMLGERFQDSEGGALQLLAVYLATVVFWQVRSEFNPARILVERKPCFYEHFDFGRQFFAGKVAAAEHDECFRFNEPVFSNVPNDRTLKHRLVL